MSALTDAMQFFMSRGYSRAGAAGIVSNLRYESGSGLNPLASNLSGSERGGVLSGGAIGIAQWNGVRQTNLFNFAQRTGQPWQSRSTQLAFVDHEIRQMGLFGFLASTNNPAQAAGFVVNRYEIPKDKLGAIAVRAPFASQLARGGPAGGVETSLSFFDGGSSGQAPTLGADPNGGAFGLGGPNAAAAGGGIAVTPDTPSGSTVAGTTPPASAGGAFGALAGMWEAMGVTAVSTAGKAVAESNKASSERISTAVEGSTEKAVTAGTTWLDTFLAGTRDLFVRFGLIVLGGLLLLGGVLYFSKKGD